MRRVWSSVIAMILSLAASHAALGFELKVPEYGIIGLEIFDDYRLPVLFNDADKLYPTLKVTLRSVETNQIIGRAIVKKVYSLKKNPALIKRDWRMIYYHHWFFDQQVVQLKKARVVEFEKLDLDRAYLTKREDGEKFPQLRRYYPGVKTINKREMVSLVRSGAIALDVSYARKPLQTMLKIPNAKALPYTDGLRIGVAGDQRAFSDYGGYGFLMQDIRSIVAKGKFLDQGLLKQLLAKQRSGKPPKLVVFCQSEIDVTCSKALLKFRSLGFTQLYWYRGGAWGWANRITLIPKQIPGVGLFKYRDFPNLKKGEHIFVDVRSRKKFKRNHINNAVSAVYPLAKLEGYPFTRSSYPKTEKEIRTVAKSAFRNNFGTPEILRFKDKTVIVYGNGPHSWTAYLAAITLRDAGFKEVLLYHGGYVDFQNHVLRLEAKMGKQGKPKEAQGKKG